MSDVSARVLRLAAAKMRAQWTTSGLTAPDDSEARFYAALSVWLDNAANSHECAVSLGARGLAPDYPAFAVARAYLGESA